MLNVKENKYIEIKGMVLTGTPERPVYSGGTMTAYHPEAYGVEVKENHPERSWDNVAPPAFHPGKH